MANAKICDRCGTVYSPPLRLPHIGVFNSRSQRLSNEFYDLCEGCTVQLEAFMNEYNPVVNVNQES